jgi:hypothetical protein
MVKPMDTSSLDELIRESEEAIKRLEAAQLGTKGLPLSQRINLHLRKNSSAFINIMMAGSVLVVAVGRLAQKQQHEVRQQCWKGLGAGVSTSLLVGGVTLLDRPA